MLHTLKRGECSSDSQVCQLDEEIRFLMQSDVDTKCFYENFCGDQEKMYFSMLKFREHKRGTKDISLEDFLQLYRMNRIQALEELFQHPIIEYDVRQLEGEIANQKITLKRLYELKQRYKKRRLLRLLFSTTY